MKFFHMTRGAHVHVFYFELGPPQSGITGPTHQWPWSVGEPTPAQPVLFASTQRASPAPEPVSSLDGPCSGGGTEHPHASHQPDRPLT